MGIEGILEEGPTCLATAAAQVPCVSKESGQIVITLNDSVVDKFTVTSNGFFAIQLNTPGTYTVTGTVPGAKSLRPAAITVNLASGQMVSVTLVMETGIA